MVIQTYCTYLNEGSMYINDHVYNNVISPNVQSNWYMYIIIC